MNDQQFIDEYIKAAKLIFSSLTQDAVIIKDIDLRFLTLTHKMAELMGIDSANQAIGKTTEEVCQLFSLDNQLVEEFKRQDVEVIQAKVNKVYLEIVQDGKKRICVAYKTPIINPDTNNCVGIRIQITKMYWPNVIKALFKLHGASGLLISGQNNGNPLEAYPLTEAQHIVLYLCICNYSYTEIALFMNEFGHEITSVRVNDYLEQLKLIFHVRTKAQLVEKAIGLNFHTYLPLGLFNSISSIDITNEAAEIINLVK